MAAANGDAVSGSSHFLLKAVAAAGKKPAGKGTGRKTRNEGGTEEGEEADSELIDDYCKRRLSGPSVRPTVTAFGGRWNF